MFKTKVNNSAPTIYSCIHTLKRDTKNTPRKVKHILNKDKMKITYRGQLG